MTIVPDIGGHRHPPTDSVRLPTSRFMLTILSIVSGRGSDKEVNDMASAVAAQVISELHGQAIVTSQQLAAEVLKILKLHDPLAYLRYGSAIKRYRSVDDFWLDTLALLNPPERAGPHRAPIRRM